LHSRASRIDIIDEQKRFASAALGFLHSKSAANVATSFCGAQTNLGKRRTMPDEHISPERNINALTHMAGQSQCLIKLADT
jgi:hypothetical protein